MKVGEVLSKKKKSAEADKRAGKQAGKQADKPAGAQADKPAGERAGERSGAPAVCKVVGRIKLPTGIMGCDCTADGRTVYAACIDGGIYRVDVKGKSYEKIGAHGSYASSVAVLNEAGCVVSGGYDGVLRWFDLKSGEAMREVKAHGFWSWDMACSADERFVASVTGQYMVGGYDYEPAAETESSVKVFDAASGELVWSLGHLPPVQSVVFDPSSRFVAASNRMGDVHVWDVESGARVSSFGTPDFTTWGVRKSHFFAGGITASAFTVDGKSLLFAGQGEMSKPITSNGQQLWQKFDWRGGVDGGGGGGKKVGETHKGESGLGLMETLCVHPGGDFFVMAGRVVTGDWNVGLFDVESGVIFQSLATKTRIVDSAFSGDGDVLFLAGMLGQGKNEKLGNDYGVIDVCEVSV